jgi:hypothetical protein
MARKPNGRMNVGMQKWNIGRMVAGTRINTEMVDIHALIDSKLHYGENKANIARHLGTHRTSHDQSHNRDFHQIAMPETPRGYEMDLARKAMPPGKRFVHHPGGRTTIYYERRSNRSDVPGTTL